ncbi:STAS domain-containing protein [methanotrophic endosymbiont of Bathymodiolus puteoserpentis (Logatchev)]|jgi:phospholipid transport system transporter-binding protein|uniref:STAS domain-containing protein n=1 Tax=methanotrophic endosymbiont of Bathymodiolus puteoserpentis (Logatchev) TaxID=343235 RepID=UPI00157B40F6
MQNIQITRPKPECYLLKGDLIFSTINKTVLRTLDLKQSPSSITINLQQVGEIDSAGLALLIEWIKFAQAHQKKLYFDNIPAQLTALAKLSYISETDLFTTKA